MRCAIRQTARVCRSTSLRTVRSFRSNITLRLGEGPENPFGYPAFVKPARLGSSVGISKVHDEEELAAAVTLAFEHDEKVLVEEFVDGVEVECGVLGNEQPEASLPGEIVSHGFEGADWYDYSAKYEDGGMDLIVPPRLEQAIRTDAFLDAMTVANSLGRLAQRSADGARYLIVDALGVPTSRQVADLQRSMDKLVEAQQSTRAGGDDSTPAP